MSEKWMPKSIESKKDVFQVKFHPAPLVYGYLEHLMSNQQFSQICARVTYILAVEHGVP